MFGRNFFRSKTIDRLSHVPHSSIRDTCDLIQLRSIDHEDELGIAPGNNYF